MRRVDSIRTAWLVMAVAAAVAPPAGADGECFKGYRDTTAAERATMTAALETVRSALPAPAQGWVLQGDDAIAVTQGLCRDYEAGPWSYGFTRYYQRIDDRETRDQILADAAADYSARMAERQAELQALEARVTELTQAAVAAAQAGDYERIETINREIEQYSAQQQRIYDAASVNMEAATAEAGRDQVMTITVTVNPRGESATEGEPIPPPAGAQSAFRSSSTREGIEEDTAIVLLGTWAPGSYGTLAPVPRAGAAAPEVQGISVRLTADPGRVDANLNAIDFAALAGLLRH